MVIELRVVQFWSEIILVISNRIRAARSFDFEITRMISDQIALHSIQLPLLILWIKDLVIFGKRVNLGFQKRAPYILPSEAHVPYLIRHVTHCISFIWFPAS